MGVKLHEGSELVLFKDMGKGDVGVIERSTEYPDYSGLLVISLGVTEDKVVSFTGDTWTGLSKSTEKVRLLPKGTLLEVT